MRRSGGVAGVASEVVDVTEKLRALAAQDRALKAEVAELVERLVGELHGEGLSAGLLAKLSTSELVEVGLVTASGCPSLRAEQLDALEVALGCSQAGPAIMAQAAEVVAVLRDRVAGGAGDSTRVMTPVGGPRTTVM